MCGQVAVQPGQVVAQHGPVPLGKRCCTRFEGVRHGIRTVTLTGVQHREDAPDQGRGEGRIGPPGGDEHLDRSSLRLPVHVEKRIQRLGILLV